MYRRQRLKAHLATAITDAEARELLAAILSRWGERLYPRLERDVDADLLTTRPADFEGGWGAGATAPGYWAQTSRRWTLWWG